MTAARVLVIEDSRTECALVRRCLESVGYLVSTAMDGLAGVRELHRFRPDVVVLDVLMSGLDGWATLDRIREVSNVPVMMLTAHDSELERVRGLRGGADDYIGKPFSDVELAARVGAVLRRSWGEPALREVYDDGTVRIDYPNRTVSVRGNEIDLTPLEFRLLDAFTTHAGQVLSRAQLLEMVWMDYSRNERDNRVKLYVAYLRRKIERRPSEPELIQSLRGFGYRYVTVVSNC